MLPSFFPTASRRARGASLLAGIGLIPATVLMATPAGAATAYFDFLNPGGYQVVEDVTFSDSANQVDVTVTGGVYDSQGGGYPNAPLPGTVFGDVVGYSAYGLSVDNSALFACCNDGSHQLDGNGGRDFLRFAFSVPVSLVHLTLSYIGHDDNFDFGIDGVDVAVASTLGTDQVNQFPTGYQFDQDNGTTMNVPGHTSDHVVSFLGKPVLANKTGAPEIGKGFVFDFYTNGHDDDYKIAKMLVHYDDDPSIGTPVPLPGTAVLLLGALGALAVRRRLA